MTALSKNRTARLAQGLAAAAKASDSRSTRVAAAQRAVQHLENGGLVATEALTEEERAGLDYSKQGNTEMYTADKPAAARGAQAGSAGEGRDRAVVALHASG